MTDIKRRQFTRLVGRSFAFIPLASLIASKSSAAEGITPLDPESAVAKSLNFTPESDTEGAQCATCLFYSSVNDDIGKCVVFGGAGVPPKGWCNSFQPKKTP